MYYFTNHNTASKLQYELIGFPTAGKSFFSPHSSSRTDVSFKLNFHLSSLPINLSKTCRILGRGIIEKAFKRSRETMDRPAKGKGRRKRCIQSNPIPTRQSQSPDRIASQPQMPLTPPEQNALPAVRNASSAVEIEAIDFTVSFLAPDSSSRDGDEMHFVSYPQQQLICYDYIDTNVPNSLKKIGRAGL